MKKPENLILLGALCTLCSFCATFVSAEAATSASKVGPRGGARKSATRSARALVGEAMRPKKSLKFDGRSVEALKPGNYDSVSHLSEGDGNRGARHLYDLPKDFSYRSADDQTELRYRQ